MDANGAELPFVLDTLGTESLEGWLRVPESFTRVEVDEFSILSLNRFIYSENSDCSGELFVSNLEPSMMPPPTE